MALVGAAAKEEAPTMVDVEEALDGNLCRCTGYRPIIEAAHAMAKDYKPELDGKLSRETGLEHFCAADAVESLLVLPEECKQPLKTLKLVTPTAAWIRPSSLAQLVAEKAATPSAAAYGIRGDKYGEDGFPAPRLISGNTEIGYKVRYHPSAKPQYATYLSTAGAPELFRVDYVEGGVRVGSATTINDFAVALKKAPASEQVKIGFKTVCNVLGHFANNQVRNMGTVGGSLVTSDPLSDLYSPLVGLGASVHLLRKDGTERDVLVNDFVHGKGKVDMAQDEVIVYVYVPYPRENEYSESYKHSKRRVDSQAIVNCTFRVWFEGKGSRVVKEMNAAFGALGSRSAMHFPDTEKAIVGKEWTEENILAACRVCYEEAKRLVEVKRGMTEYRCRLAPCLLYRFFVSVCKRAGFGAPSRTELTDVDELAEAVHHGEQTYPDPEDASKTLYKPRMHLAAAQHVTGVAKFVADEEFSGLYVAPVLSTIAHGKILAIHKEEALKMPGVVAVYTAEDIPGTNLIGSMANDEEVLASKEVLMHDQPIALVVADTHRHANAAALKVKADYEPLPIVLSIEDAIAANSYLWKPMEVNGGDCEKVFASWPKERVLEGEVRVGGQEHFYIEPQACTVWPSGDRYVVHCTSQNPTKIQGSVAAVLGKPTHFVESSMERIGGGFGGKQDRPQFTASMAAIAAYNSHRPCRIVLERDQDMRITGERHEFLVRYKVAFHENGRIEAFDAQLYNNGGYSVDLSPSVMEVALFNIDACYSIPNMHLIGRCCRTNRISCTAYRGFGKPQGIATMESVMDRIAHSCHLDPAEVRNINLLQNGEKMIDGETVDENLDRCWKPLLQKYHERLPAVRKFNSENKWRKRGLAVVPTKNNIGFETEFMNQAGALVNIYKDGSVEVSHSGCEMGQGINTKMAQVAADALGIPITKINIARTGTERVPNTHPTAACTGTDLNSGAVIDACKQLRKTIDAVRAEMKPDATWEQVIWECYFRRLNLSASGHYCFPYYGWNWETKKGFASYYRIWGAALTEVELDVLTGGWRIVRTDIIQDNGAGLNYAIDIGQVEGGFIQGLGLFCMEDLIWAKDGHLRTRNVSTYKIPAHDDVPVEFNVEMLRSKNPRAVTGNKTVGEAGIQLAISVVHAIKDAIYEARKETMPKEKAEEFFQLDTPTTVEKINKFCPIPF